MEKEIILPKNIDILDSSILSISIYEANLVPHVKVLLKLVYPHNHYFMIIFKDVLCYSFSWNCDFIFYNVESYKLSINNEGLIYFSLDPDDSNLDRLESDNDYIVSKEIELYLSQDKDFIKKDVIQFE